MTREDIIQAIKEMSVLDLNELVKACEEEFGVSAAAAVVAGGAVAGAAAAEVQGRAKASRVLALDLLRHCGRDVGEHGELLGGHVTNTVRFRQQPVAERGGAR